LLLHLPDQLERVVHAALHDAAGDEGVPGDHVAGKILRAASMSPRRAYMSISAFCTNRLPAMPRFATPFIEMLSVYSMKRSLYIH
jgi:hypothetical protein